MTPAERQTVIDALEIAFYRSGTEEVARISREALAIMLREKPVAMNAIIDPQMPSDQARFLDDSGREIGRVINIGKD